MNSQKLGFEATGGFFGGVREQGDLFHLYNSDASATAAAMQATLETIAGVGNIYRCRNVMLPNLQSNYTGSSGAERCAATSGQFKVSLGNATVQTVVHGPRKAFVHTANGSGALLWMAQDGFEIDYQIKEYAFDQVGETNVEV